MCSFAEFNRSKLDICTNLQKKTLYWRANIFGGMELVNNTHHIRLMDFGELSSDL